MTGSRIPDTGKEDAPQKRLRRTFYASNTDVPEKARPTLLLRRRLQDAASRSLFPRVRVPRCFVPRFGIPGRLPNTLRQR